MAFCADSGECRTLLGKGRFSKLLAWLDFSLPGDVDSGEIYFVVAYLERSRQGNNGVLKGWLAKGGMALLVETLSKSQRLELSEAEFHAKELLNELDLCGPQDKG
jgi:hypothetical protein